MRSLDAEEQALWDRVAATIRPLSREKLNPAAQLSEKSTRGSSSPKAVSRRPVAVPAPPPKARDVSNATLDASWDRRLSSGSVEPDRTLDLHGLNLDQAWSAIDRGLERAISAGDRVLLLITGHAPSGAPPVQRGRIRAAVHDWLAASRHASKIAAVRGAHRRHGGGGSLYIILRRNRPGSTFS